MSKKLHFRRLTTMQRQQIVTNLYSRANFSFQSGYFKKLESGVARLELSHVAKREAERKRNNEPNYFERMLKYRENWLLENSDKRDSFLSLLSEEKYSQMENELFFRFLHGLGFKGINIDKIYENNLLSGYFEEYDPEFAKENEFDKENSPETKEIKKEEQIIEEQTIEINQSKIENQDPIEKETEKELA